MGYFRLRPARRQAPRTGTGGRPGAIHQPATGDQGRSGSSFTTMNVKDFHEK
jgi:hypothetical protein